MKLYIALITADTIRSIYEGSNDRFHVIDRDHHRLFVSNYIAKIYIYIQVV